MLIVFKCGKVEQFTVSSQKISRILQIPPPPQLLHPHPLSTPPPQFIFYIFFYEIQTHKKFKRMLFISTGQENSIAQAKTDMS